MVGQRAGGSPSALFYFCVLTTWALALVWLGPKLLELLHLATTPGRAVALIFFIAFVAVAWLYGTYNVAVVAFAIARRLTTKTTSLIPGRSEGPAVAILYTTCNDFREEAARSCLALDYSPFTVYLLDDGTDASTRERIDAFAAGAPDRVVVVRRAGRRGHKAGNLNDALRGAAAGEPLFALVDADEVLPPDFLRRLVPLLLADARRGFVQANHRGNPADTSPLQRVLGVGIDIHWRYYQPLRNRCGFVMLLGHGALLRRACWEEVGGFPEIVSEDLAYAVRIRARGWRGYFAEDVICLESFPETMRAFRVRHMKWTRGTCEFLFREGGALLRAGRISRVEKLDILFTTSGLPVSLLFLFFVLDANLVLPALFGRPGTLTLQAGAASLAVPTVLLDPVFAAVLTPEFLVVTLVAILSPILCFVLDLAQRPLVLARFLAASVVTYGALAPLSAVGVLAFAATRRAVFHVTGEARSTRRRGLGAGHPDQLPVQLFEAGIGAALVAVGAAGLQPSLLGVGLSYALHPLLHHVMWGTSLARALVPVPLALLLMGGLVTALAAIVR